MPAIAEILVRLARCQAQRVARFGAERAIRNAVDAVDVQRRAVDSVEQQLHALRRRDHSAAA